MDFQVQACLLLSISVAKREAARAATVQPKGQARRQRGVGSRGRHARVAARAPSPGARGALSGAWSGDIGPWVRVDG